MTDAEITQQQRLTRLQELFFSQTQQFLAGGPSHEQPWAAAWARLEKEALDREDVERLPLGLAADCQAMTAGLAGAGFLPAEIDASELLADSRISGRLIGPIRDRQGRIVSFWARDPEDRRPKYLFKGKWKDEVPAVGLDLALTPDAGGRQNLVLVERFFDWLLLHACDFTSAAALAGSGKDLTRKRWQQLAACGIARVTLVPHADEAGQRGARIAVENALRTPLAPEVFVVLPGALRGCRTAGDFVRAEGIEAFRRLLETGVVEGSVYLNPPRPEVHEPEEEIEPLLEEPPVEPEPTPPPRKPSSRNEFCTLHQCAATDCFCFD